MFGVHIQNDIVLCYHLISLIDIILAYTAKPPQPRRSFAIRWILNGRVLSHGTDPAVRALRFYNPCHDVHNSYPILRIYPG